MMSEQIPYLASSVLSNTDVVWVDDGPVEILEKVYRELESRIGAENDIRQEKSWESLAWEIGVFA